MCGILCVFGKPGANTTDLRKKFLRLSKKLRHRGPDWNGIVVQETKGSNDVQMLNVLCHERLAIVDPGTGAQPLSNEKANVTLSVNGEIYNHLHLRTLLKQEHNFKTKSDCEPILYLYEEMGDEFCNLLDGMFAFVVSDSANGTYLAARDPIGICPLYIGWAHDGSVWFSSEMKAILEDCDRVREFPPGHYWSSKTMDFVRYYQPSWWNGEIVPTTPLDLGKIKSALETAVIKRLMSDVPFGVLLSGGLDSSLVSSIVSRYMKETSAKADSNINWGSKLHSFSVGLKDSPDLKAAQSVATFLGTAHHEFTFTIEEGIDALSDVIYHLETYDVTTVRASTPMYLLSRKIKAMGVKMVLSGEGADEIFGGYLYFHKAPTAAKFHKECVDKVKMLSKYDCLRANKSPAAWGVEVRVPFLDKEFLEVVLGTDPENKMIRDGKIEKYILRKAFDDKENPYLPDSVLWRQKEQFSDGVGYGWIDSLRAHAAKEITDEQLKMAHHRFPYNTPATKEAYLYRSIFQSFFPKDSAAETVPGGPSIACSTPAAIEWEKSWAGQADPSGRSIAVHVDANVKK
eukprot:TRINITY_DN21396_c0_g1_i1.p1 TRINITY_DN21396_c0_g1~~TRINITY_DN21396_c0_g1_i1.p1  ORF type:complete len:571 (-),score=189.39 TRINITY_DN21396_c0_g1_i1:44-1756(-)